MADERSALVPVQERTVDFYGDQVLAVLVDSAGEQQVYVPLRPICQYLGVDWASQYQRMKRDKILAGGIRSVVVKTTDRGDRPMVCLPLDLLPGWLFGISSARVRPELQDKIDRYRAECFRALWRAFQSEAIARQPSPTSGSLAQIRAMGLAIAQLAEQQMAMEERVNQHDVRLDRAAEAFKALDRRVMGIEQQMRGGLTIADEQATEVSSRVKALAELLTAKDTTTTQAGQGLAPQRGSGSQNHYQGIFAELYRRFGVSSYKLIRTDQYQAVLQFLEDWRQAATASP